MKDMNHLNKISDMKIQELELEECVKIFGGDEITQSVFSYLGSVWAGIVKGQPHASYGRYAGM